MTNKVKPLTKTIQIRSQVRAVRECRQGQQQERLFVSILGATPVLKDSLPELLAIFPELKVAKKESAGEYGSVGQDLVKFECFKVDIIDDDDYDAFGKLIEREVKRLNKQHSNRFYPGFFMGW